MSAYTRKLLMILMEAKSFIQLWIYSLTEALRSISVCPWAWTIVNREFSTFVLRTLRTNKDRYYGTDIWEEKKATTVHFSADLPNLPRAKRLTSPCKIQVSLPECEVSSKFWFIVWQCCRLDLMTTTINFAAQVRTNRVKEFTLANQFIVIYGGETCVMVTS